MKYASLKYDVSLNLGDQIQSLAVEQYLPSVDALYDRDTLKLASPNSKHIIIMNGWFSHSPQKCFPPSDNIVPVFIGLHFSNKKTNKHFLSSHCLEYFKKYEPIGCRDRHTQGLLNQSGIDTFYSKCLTLTFPKREQAPTNGKVFLVDVENIPIPKVLKKGSVKLSPEVNSIFVEEVKRQMARELLDIYKHEARLVITTRLHCALPCLAMGIPVIFFGDENDKRFSILKDLNLTIHHMPKRQKGIMKYLAKKSYLSYLKKINWEPDVLDIHKEKELLINRTKHMIASAKSGPK